MGIYDRDYYRKDGPSYIESLVPSGYVCKWLIALNVGMYVLQLLTQSWDPLGAGRAEGVTDWLFLDPEAIRHGEIWRLLTHTFLHDPHDIRHLAFNMIALWMFGSDIEGIYGPREFLLFYLVSGLCGGLLYFAQALTLGNFVGAYGASGAVTGVMVLYVFHFPARPIYLFFVFPIPAVIFVAGFVAMDSFYFVTGIRNGTAVAGHLGGAAFGALYHLNHMHLSGFIQSLTQWWKRPSLCQQPRLRVYPPVEDEPEPVAVAAPRTRDLDEHLEAKLDAVLEKVARHGQNSLTESERQILLRASEIYKKRRS